MRTVCSPAKSFCAGTAPSSRSSRASSPAKASTSPRSMASGTIVYPTSAICSRWPARSIVAVVICVSVEVNGLCHHGGAVRRGIALLAEIHGAWEGDMGAAIERSGSRQHAPVGWRRLAVAVVVTAGLLVGGAGFGGVAAAAPPTHVSDCTGSASPARRWVSLLYIRALFRCDSGPDSEFGIRHFDPDAVRGSYSRSVYRSTEGSRKWVAQAFVQFLRRNPDPGGSAFWTSHVHSGTRYDAFESTLIGSNEYFNNAGATNSNFIEAAYNDLLDRSAHTSEANFWLNRLAAGSTRT